MSHFGDIIWNVCVGVSLAYDTQGSAESLATTVAIIAHLWGPQQLSLEKCRGPMRLLKHRKIHFFFHERKKGLREKLKKKF